jgi:hypothetical protein
MFMNLKAYCGFESLSLRPAFAYARQTKHELRLGKPDEGCRAEARSAKADLSASASARM